MYKIINKQTKEVLLTTKLKQTAEICIKPEHVELEVEQYFVLRVWEEPNNNCYFEHYKTLQEALKAVVELTTWNKHVSAIEIY